MRLSLFGFLFMLLLGCNAPSPTEIPAAEDSITEAPTPNVLLPSALNWGALNPARGDNSPRAANLWGDRTTPGGAGFLVRFKEGFSSPPHIHNVRYRAIVVEGRVHNDDPEAANLWMPPGSYWTQPAGEVHITAAEAPANLAYVEIEEGPYLVKPSSEQFESGEWPINIHVDNLVWTEKLPAALTVKSTDTAEIAHLYQNSGSANYRGALLRLPVGFSGSLNLKGVDATAILIAGAANYATTENTNELTPGTTITAEERLVFPLTTSTEVIFYLRWRR